jgi:ABC-type antimicrobial peptide transport system permease subunit
MKSLNLKIALRSLVHYRLYSSINIIGLAISLSCVIIISRYVYNELSVEKFNSKLDRIYIYATENSTSPGEIRFSGIYNPYHEPAFRDLTEHPGVERHSQIMKLADNDISIDNQLYNADILVIDTNFMKIFDYPVIGAANIVRPEDVLISEEFAKKIFGKKNPLGEKILYIGTNKELTVTGIIRKLSTKNIISFDIIVSSELTDRWDRIPYSLILLYPNVNYKDINKQYGEFMEMSHWFYSIRHQLFPYKDVYFNKEIRDHSNFKHGNYMYLLILSIVGGLLLLIGIINYINIYTVVILRRNREFGMKKVFGAEGYRIFIQLFSENMILIAISLIIAFGLSELFSPFVTRYFELEQVLNIKFDLLLAIIILLILPLITSILPFIRYQYASPIKSLNAVGIGGKSLFSRKFFLCFQYFITLVMIVVSLFFVKQLNYMLDQDLGYRTKNIIKVPFDKYINYYMISIDERKSVYEKSVKIRSELKQKMDASPLFEYWTNGESPNKCNHDFDFRVPGGEMLPTNLIGANDKWLKLFEIPLINGRSWDDEKDHLHNYIMLAGESTLKQYGITDYHEAELEACRRIWWSHEQDESQNPSYRIVGVVKDFYIAHLSKKQNPITIYFINGQYFEPVIASFHPQNKKAVIEFMKNLHDELIGGEFNYSFVEDEVAEMYKEDKKVAAIYSVFTGIAILISILGLFGLSLFDMQQRRKEIAIRKVNGASTYQIILLLMKKYFILLGIAFVFSVPIALFAIQKYLENFALKAPISWWLFFVAIIITATVSAMTLIYQTYKASNENPAFVIRS